MKKVLLGFAIVAIAFSANAQKVSAVSFDKNTSYLHEGIVDTLQKKNFQIDIAPIPKIPNGYNVDCSFSKTKGGSPIFLTTINAGGGAIMNLNGKIVKLTPPISMTKTKLF